MTATCLQRRGEQQTAGSLEEYEAPAGRVPEVLGQHEAQAFCSELLTNGHGVHMSSSGSSCLLGLELFDFLAGCRGGRSGGTSFATRPHFLLHTLDVTWGLLCLEQSPWGLKRK